MRTPEIQDVRARLGEMWGLGRPLRASELGRVLRLTDRDPGRHVLGMERGTRTMSGPISLALDLLLAGGRPPGLAEIVPGVEDAPGV